MRTTAHVRMVPGRKTDVKDSQWLAQLMELGLLRGFIPPADIQAMRDLTRYRTRLTQERTREKQRALKGSRPPGMSPAGFGRPFGSA